MFFGRRAALSKLITIYRPVGFCIVSVKKIQALKNNLWIKDHCTERQL